MFLSNENNRQDIQFSLIKIVLVFAILNATLRITASGITSFYRLTSPLLLIILIIKNPLIKIKKIIIFLFIPSYSILVSVLAYNHISFEFYAHYLYLCLLYYFIYTYSVLDKDFTTNFFSFINVITIVTLILYVIQFFTRFNFPYIETVQEVGTLGVPLFASNENEIATPLGCMALLYLYLSLYEHQKKHLWKVLAILIVLFLNDAKLTIIGCFVGFFGLFIFLQRKNNFLGKKELYKLTPYSFLFILLFFLVVFLVAIYVINPIIVFRDNNISIKDLIFDSVWHILAHEELSGDCGSTFARTNAIIYGLKELKKSKYLGIGLGNSIYMLSFTEYYLDDAASMHNFVFQIICEFGFVAFLSIGLFLKWIVNNFRYIDEDNTIVLKIVFAIAFVFISSQSSSGIFSNYFFWIVVIYIALLPRKRILE